MCAFVTKICLHITCLWYRYKERETMRGKRIEREYVEFSTHMPATSFFTFVSTTFDLNSWVTSEHDLNRRPKGMYPLNWVCHIHNLRVKGLTCNAIGWLKNLVLHEQPVTDWPVWTPFEWNRHSRVPSIYSRHRYLCSILRAPPVVVLGTKFSHFPQN